ncbi:MULTISPECIES: NTP transferase domain-containing protein [unclassified Lentimonas]|uniref:nucleotidyltransferase family protein n=1 Tax=unclassified Lentimonas TaxID=2630993 RepID=UPI00132AD7CE|nr:MULTISPECIES: nucleotidyltransferase family protein [unclassified Lentimonas]CAA6690680.1 Unannotated [Lentimonas sp. CC19]CAA6693395.1 Unannotated [Lentimonas sp. CC10]CAA7071856.1 Unannotated [Lentimonas sp. CC11]
MLNQSTQIGAVILAAGSSSRLGTPKQLVTHNGTNLLEQTIQAVRSASNGPILIVTGAHAERIEATLSSLTQKNIRIHRNTNWESGMGNSLAHGVSALLENAPHLSAILVSVCDQLHINATHIDTLLDRSTQEPDRIVASKYGDTIGPPVLFPKTYFTDLKNCSGDQGAKAILSRNLNAVVTVDFPNGEVDIDTPDDLKLLPS